MNLFDIKQFHKDEFSEKYKMLDVKKSGINFRPEFTDKFLKENQNYVYMDNESKNLMIFNRSLLDQGLNFESKA